MDNTVVAEIIMETTTNLNIVKPFFLEFGITFGVIDSDAVLKFNPALSGYFENAIAFQRVDDSFIVKNPSPAQLALYKDLEDVYIYLPNEDRFFECRLRKSVTETVRNGHRLNRYQLEIKEVDVSKFPSELGKLLKFFFELSTGKKVPSNRGWFFF